MEKIVKINKIKEKKEINKFKPDEVDFLEDDLNVTFEDETPEIDKKDILALIIAASEILLPLVIGFVLIFAAVVFLFTKILR